MKARTASGLAWSLWVLGAGTVLVESAYGLLRGDFAGGVDQIAVWLTFVAFVVACVTVGAIVASRRPSNPIGWLLLASGLCYTLAGAGLFLVKFHGTPQALGEWLGWAWGVGSTLPLFVLLLFPEGRLPSRRWRPVAWIAAVGLVGFVLGSAFRPGNIPDTSIKNPVGVGGIAGDVLSILRGALVLVLLAGVASIASLMFRYRRAQSQEREQIKWLTYAGALVGLGILAQVVIDQAMGPTEFATDIENAVITGTLSFVPVAIGIAIMKYRLYDIDIVINKTLVYGGLAAFITTVYVAIVVGFGSLVGRGDRPNVALSILATAVVAVAFQPVRERVQRFANRLVYGKRATPYEVLSEFSQRMGGTYATEELLPRMARILAEGTGAARADVWLKVADELRPEASWPTGETATQLENAERAVEVRHQGEVLGALTLTKKPGEALTPTEDKLIADLASQAGLVLRNVGLTEQLLARLDELKASRQRLVAAQDEERRKLERNLHDGAQQQLVALAVKLRLAEGHIGKDGEQAHRLLGEIQAETTEALENLRDLARGIYPPLLADKGLAAALEAQVRKSSFSVTIETDGVGRYAQEIEAAVYFCCLEALANVAKYAEAAHTTLRLAKVAGELRFEVIDDGRGIDPYAMGYGTGLQGIADRLEALGGDIEVRSAPDEGTTIAGRLTVGLPEVTR